MNLRMQHHETKQIIAQTLGYDDPLSAICELYVRQRKSAAQIADIFEVTEAAISYRLKQAGVKLNQKIKLSDTQVRKIRKERGRLKDIAEKYGVSVTHVWRIQRYEERKGVV